VFIVTNKTVVDYLPGLQPKALYKQAIEKTLHGPEKALPPKNPQASPQQKPSTDALAEPDSE
jgi:hypothetical protein